jgi:peptidoglycan hydrolase-like protein with peptidoglycan-binding domain
MSLAHPPFVASERIPKAAENSPPMSYGEQGYPVAILQGALIDLEYKMPKSKQKSGTPDGRYGKETKAVVTQFQIDKELLGKDGAAGRETFARLDALLMAKKGQSKSSSKPPVPPPPSNRHYKIGTGDPAVKPDVGAGLFNSVSTEVSMIALKQAILEILPPRGASAMTFIGFDAAAHMKHYLDASGTNYTIKLESMVDSGLTSRGRFRNEVRQAQKFVESLNVGTHSITSKSIEGAYNYKNESKNWYFAVGGYSTWGKGTAIVREGGSGREYELQFEYKFFDRYNWDKGKSVTIAGITITDKFMGDFHRQGLAKEFNMIGSIKRTFRWQHGKTIPEEQYRRGGGR